MPKVFVLSRSFGKFCEKALKIIEQIAEIERIPREKTIGEEDLLQTIKNADAIIVGTERIGRKIIEHCRRLRMIAKHGVGIDNIDLRAATDRGIVVTYAPHANAEAVADFTFGLIISIARRIPQAHFSTIHGMWEGPKFMGNEVYGKTIGIIGLGEIGYRVAKRAMGFNMNILVYDPYVSSEKAREISAKVVSLEKLLRESDFVTLHVPLTNETRGMIGKKELNFMKKTAYLINTSRGAIVNEKALYEALKEGKIAGAAIDVYSREPPDSDFPLFELDNVIMTPHIAAYTVEAMNRMDLTIAEDIIRFFKGEKPRYIANPEVIKNKEEK
ncbi:MAG: phosphoglycerate dehydrogenase [Candidatus Odinarchaeota archaeon]|nr:phosphoglycerate dehydrogenase [Candidatus Odinarchaeota archaeon]